ncbi:MAG: indole-3-glycerol-phosphate synthase [Phycisphaerales bacterium JB039]
MTATLAEIIEHKRREVSEVMADRPLAEVRAEGSGTPAPRDFFGAVTGRSGPGPVAIIAEIKRRSPSAGQIRPEYAGEGFAPERIARLYAEHGASAISCLTDEKFFDGRSAFIGRVKAACPLPVLRKDFLIDPRQVWESRTLGADAVLLIAECLPGDELARMAEEAAEAGLACLIEIHDEANLERAAGLLEGAGAAGRLLGINNRDLRTMRTDLGHTLRLCGRVADGSRLVSESGIRTRGDLDRLASAGVGAALVGESLMRQADPGMALRKLLDPKGP